MFFLRLFSNIPFDDIANKFFTDIETVKWIALGFPCAIFMASLGLYRNLLTPHENNKILYQWPDYNKYEITARIGLCFCLLPIPSTIISVFWFDKYKEYDIGFYYVLLLGISIISIISLYFAKFEAKRIIQELS
jgi:hypothetical protein